MGFPRLFPKAMKIRGMILIPPLENFGNPKSGLFQTWLFAILLFCPLCALLPSLRHFAPFCTLLRSAPCFCAHLRLLAAFFIQPRLPLGQKQSGHNLKTVFLCICICYAIKIMSKTILICYSVPSKLQRAAVSASATRN